jgi:hypothetical protein
LAGFVGIQSPGYTNQSTSTQQANSDYNVKEREAQLKKRKQRRETFSVRMSELNEQLAGIHEEMHTASREEGDMYNTFQNMVDGYEQEQLEKKQQQLQHLQQQQQQQQPKPLPQPFPRNPSPVIQQLPPQYLHQNPNQVRKTSTTVSEVDDEIRRLIEEQQEEQRRYDQTQQQKGLEAAQLTLEANSQMDESLDLELDLIQRRIFENAGAQMASNGRAKETYNYDSLLATRLASERRRSSPDAQAQSNSNQYLDTTSNFERKLKADDERVRAVKMIDNQEIERYILQLDRHYSHLAAEQEKEQKSVELELQFVRLQQERSLEKKLKDKIAAWERRDEDMAVGLRQQRADEASIIRQLKQFAEKQDQRPRAVTQTQRDLERYTSEIDYLCEFLDAHERDEIAQLRPAFSTRQLTGTSEAEEEEELQQLSELASELERSSVSISKQTRPKRLASNQSKNNTITSASVGNNGNQPGTPTHRNSQGDGELEGHTRSTHAKSRLPASITQQQPPSPQRENSLVPPSQDSSRRSPSTAQSPGTPPTLHQPVNSAITAEPPPKPGPELGDRRSRSSAMSENGDYRVISSSKEYDPLIRRLFNFLSLFLFLLCFFLFYFLTFFLSFFSL